MKNLYSFDVTYILVCAACGLVQEEKFKVAPLAEQRNPYTPSGRVCVDGLLYCDIHQISLVVDEQEPQRISLKGG